MKATGLIAKAQIAINASPENIWEALTDPAKIKQYMFGSDAKSDFKKNSKISFTGEWEGKSFEERGTILDAEPGRLLRYNTFTPQSGKADVEENYHTITIELNKNGEKTDVTLSQDNNESEEMTKHSEKNWKMMLDKLKQVVEKEQEL